MGNITVTLSANAGVAIQIGGKRIWVDAFHRRKATGFSTVSPELFGKILKAEAFQNPDAICYTHCHLDHFSKMMTVEAMNRWPAAQVFLPEQQLPGQTLVTEQQSRFQLGEVTLQFLQLPHEGARYADTIHYGLLILSPEGKVLVSGDCAVASPVLAQALTGITLDAAILDFPWLTLSRGREFIKQLQAKQIILYHLPFSEDDVSGYRQSAEKAVSRWEQGNAQLLWQPLQTISL